MLQFAQSEFLGFWGGWVFWLFFFFLRERGRNFPLLENFKTSQSCLEGDSASCEHNTQSPSFTLLCCPAL